MSQSEDTLEARAFTVEGMTCAHCVLSVREEVSEVAGVSAVDVDLASGRMTVSGEQSTSTRCALPSPRPATRSPDEDHLPRLGRGHRRRRLRAMRQRRLAP